MKIEETNLEGCFVVVPKSFGDHRGWFMESFSLRKFVEAGYDVNFVQDNHSFSKECGTLRGLHFQNPPYEQSKLVRCTKGRILDVAVDLRPNSKTYKKWFSIELSQINQKQLFIPRGFAHGFVTLCDDVEVQYKTDNYYDTNSDRSIKFDDPELKIDWNIESPILSEKDLMAPNLSNVDIKF